MERNKLQDHRFLFSSESANILELVRDFVIRLKQKFPEVCGVSFFGSRTHATEKSNSDLDAFLFYDGTNFPQLSDLNKPGFVKEGGKIFIRPSVVAERKKKYEQKLELEQMLLKELECYLQSIGVVTEGASGLSVIDICKRTTSKLIDAFEQRYALEIAQGKEINIHSLPPEVMELASRFFLGSGEGLYENREYIIEELAKRINGDKLFELLMSYLSYIERDAQTRKRSSLVKFQKYPKTIEEAKKYFLIKPSRLTVRRKGYNV